MRIGIDARELCGKPTGVGRHLAGLLEAWSHDHQAAQHAFVLYATQAIATPLANAQVHVIPGKAGTAWEQFALVRAARADRLDRFFAPGYTGPLALRTRMAVLVHDVSFAAHPEWFRWKEGLRRRALTRLSCRRAELVLTVSDAARKEILLHFGPSADRVRRIYPGVLPLRSLAAGTGGPLALFVGSIFNRRHIPDLIRAFKPIARERPDARLAIVGDNRTYPYQDPAAIAAAEGLESQVIIRSYVADDELACLYARARAFAFLSEYEGFGHPPLEALHFGVPSVLLDTDVAREVCGAAALYVKPGRIDAITDALRTLLFDEPVRNRVLAAAPAILARYSWTRAASDTLAALVDLG